MSQPSKKITIQNWDASDRPREKLHQHGASYLSNAELIAILIGSGSPN
jgi:DNA repair protein RadC